MISGINSANDVQYHYNGIPKKKTKAKQTTSNCIKRQWHEEKRSFQMVQSFDYIINTF